MKARTRKSVKFPCGYQYEGNTEIEIGFFSMGGVSTDKINLMKMPLCPLHGKQCKKNA